MSYHVNLNVPKTKKLARYCYLRAYQERRPKGACNFSVEKNYLLTKDNRKCKRYITQSQSEKSLQLPKNTIDSSLQTPEVLSLCVYEYYL